MNHSIRKILLIEDNPGDAELIRQMAISFHGNYALRTSERLSTGLKTLAEEAFDIVLLDLGLPDSSGIDTLRRLQNKEPELPIVVLTGLADEELAIKAIGLGAQDYLVKGQIDTALLIRSIGYAVERKRAEVALRESEQRFAAFMLHLPAAAWIKDLQGRYVFANAEAERIFLTPLGRLLGKTDFDIFPPETAQQFVENDRRVLAEGGSLHITEVLRQDDGVDHYSIVSKFAVPGPEGEPAHIAGVAFDITERRRAEGAVQESRERFRSLVEATSDWVWETDENGVYIYVSPQVSALLGYEPEEVLGKTPFAFMPPEEASRVSGMFKEIIASQKPFSLLENVNLAKGGNRVVLETSGVPFFDAGGTFRGYRGIDRDITERKRAEETIKYQVYHDLLTGLPNRTLFTDIINREIPQMKRTRMKLAVLYLDIDRFKNINDSLGHDAGDTLIQDIAVRLKAGMRETDAVARIGGDKFTILLPLITHPHDASRIAEKIMTVFEKTFSIKKHELRMTASIGISIYPDDGDNAESLLKNADIAMYHAKDQGRSNYQFFNAALNVRTLERILLENRLRQAIEHGELLVHYQPQMNIKTRKIVGAEALVRWRHPELGLLLPERFIPLAEEIGLIVTIDQWVLHTVCGQLRAWQQAGYSPPFVAINLSARQFQQPNLDETISEALHEAHMSPESLRIEITETIAMQDTELTSRNLNKLNSMGIHFSIDDFGTGYSSLSYLKKLPIHKLKIDKSFITDLVSDPDDRVIIQAVIAMAHSLKLEVLAEGVETEDQIAFLRSRDCDEMQGFLFSKPAQAEQFRELISLGR